MVIHEKYEVLEILAKGGNGIVYKVLEKGMGRILAVKEIALPSERKKSVLERETRIIKECFHPALPVILENFWQNGCYYIVMEYVEGITLKDFIQERGRLTVELTVRLGTAISEVLAYLHTRNQPIVYGDIKPENLIVTREGQIRLLDFGSADWEAEEGACSHGCYASLGYAAPEQRKGKKANITSDIYSFGALLHYMLTGEDPCRPPYTRRKLRECDSALPRGLEKLIERCLQEKAEDRYQSITAVMNMLQKYNKKEYFWKLFRRLGRIMGEFLGAAAVCLGFLAFAKGKQGISYRENEALYACVLFTVLAVFWRLCMVGIRGKGHPYRLEKNIWKTEKQGVEFFLFFFAMLFLGSVSFGFGVKAGRQEGKLPVTIYDESGCKLCLQENTVYSLRGAFRMEIPESCFSSGQVSRVTVTLADTGSEEILTRQFAVCPRKSSIEN